MDENGEDVATISAKGIWRKEMAPATTNTKPRTRPNNAMPNMVLMRGNMVAKTMVRDMPFSTDATINMDAEDGI